MATIKKIFSYLLPVVFMVVFLYLAFNNVNFKDVVDIISNISILWFVVYLENEFGVFN